MLTFNFMGDVMFGELLETYRRGLVTTLEKSGLDPFEHVKPVLAEGDLNMVNLECVFSDSSTLQAPFDRILIAPEKFLPLLTGSGINVVNTANNHALDHGREAFARSCDLVREHGIKIVGYDQGVWFQEEPVVVVAQGRRVAFLGYNISNFPADDRARFMDRLEDVLKETRQAAETLVVSIHWGEEYTHIPPPYVVDYGRRILDAGCDIIHGHHSHQIQGIHNDGRRLFAPSLGNFIFDQMIPANRITAVLKVVQDGGVLTHTYLPYYLNDNFQPVPAPEHTDYLVELEQLLATSLADETGEVFAETIRQRVLAGHQSNRLRMRRMMLAHFWDYLPHLKEIVAFRRGTKKLFSVIDRLDSLPD